MNACIICQEWRERPLLECAMTDLNDGRHGLKEGLSDSKVL